MCPHPGPQKMRLAKKMMNLHGWRDDEGDDDTHEAGSGGEDTAGQNPLRILEGRVRLCILCHNYNLVVMVLTTRAHLPATRRSSMTVWADGPPWNLVASAPSSVVTTWKVEGKHIISMWGFCQMTYNLPKYICDYTNTNFHSKITDLRLMAHPQGPWIGRGGKHNGNIMYEGV